MPFLSSIPYHADIKVEPAFSALVDGAPVVFDGESKPFAESRESTLQLNIDQLKISKYIDYSPVALNFKVPSGELHGDLLASFKVTKEQPAVLEISVEDARRGLGFLRGGGVAFSRLSEWQTAYLYVFATWAAVVAFLFPLVYLA